MIDLRGSKPLAPLLPSSLLIRDSARLPHRGAARTRFPGATPLPPPRRAPPASLLFPTPAFATAHRPRFLSQLSPNLSPFAPKQAGRCTPAAGSTPAGDREQLPPDQLGAKAGSPPRRARPGPASPGPAPRWEL